MHLFVNADNEIHCQKYICFSKLSIPVQQLISGVMILRHGSNVLKTGKLLPQLLNKSIGKKDLKPRDVNTGFLKKNQLARTLCLLVLEEPVSAPSCLIAPRNEEGIKKNQVRYAMASLILPLFWKKLFPVYLQP